MKIIDLNETNKALYFACLEDWSDEMKEAGNHKELWYEKMKDKGLRVKLALDDNDIEGGMIQYIPIEYSHASGRNLYFINCIWVHGYKQGRGDFRKQGMGKALLKAAEDDAKSLGAKGIVGWGISLPVWMRASWYRHNGYKKTDKQNGIILLWKPFCDDAEPPKWLLKNIKPNPDIETGTVTVTSYINGWCPAMNIINERAKRASKELGEKVTFKEISTFSREKMMECGCLDALYINNKSVNTGPPPSYKKIKRKIVKQLHKLKP